MKRAYEQDSGDESSDDSSDEDEDEDEEEDAEISDEESYIPPRQEREGRPLLDALARDDRPYLLTTPSPTQAIGLFEFQPQGKQVDPLATGSMVTGISPFGATLGTLEYNLRHAIENRDDARMTACLTEFFRHFVFLNSHITRVVSQDMERQTLLELRLAIGPFDNPAAFGMHQRLLVMLMGIAVRQIGVATPTMFSFLLDEWKRYERVLFHRPALALATLLGIGATLCHCKKDASVAYARHIFEDTSKMREWRNEVLKSPEILSTYIPSADQAYRARKMLLCNKVYFNNRLRLRRYQAVCIGTPHPEYMCQGGAMHRTHVLKLVDAIKQSIPFTVGPDALAIIQDVEDAMIYLDSHLNNMYDRDAFEALQVDLQIFLYLFQRVLQEDSAGAQNLDSLLHNSRLSVLSAPHRVTESYALRLWASQPDMVDLINYGVRGEPIIKTGRGLKKRALTVNDLVDTFHPDIIPKIHEWAPPSVLRDDDNIPRECENSKIQRHPGAQCFRFLFGLYRLHHMWSKCTSSKLLLAQRVGVERIVLDREFLDLRQPHRLMYQCTLTGVSAVEVHLQGNVAMELIKSSPGISHGNDGRVERIQTTDVGEAEIFADHLCRPDDTGGGKSMKAVVIGPWALHKVARLEAEVAHFQKLKDALQVQPDLVFVKKMMFLDFPTVTGDVKPETQVLGRMYAWVVYIPSLTMGDKHVLMTIDELKVMARQDANLAIMAKSILRPVNLVPTIAVMRRSCGDFCHWKIGDNYVSFSVETQDEVIVVKHIRIHTIAETLLGEFPDFRHAKMPDNRTTKSVIQNILEKCRGGSQYRGANIELAHCENLLNQIS